MHYDEMLSWLLFYGSLLDVSKTPQLDVIDPGGIVRSQAIQSPDGALRIALNASQSQQTLSSRFLTRVFRLWRPAHRVCEPRHRRGGEAAHAPTV